MNNQIPNHAKQEREKLIALLRMAFTSTKSIEEIADYLLDSGVMVSMMRFSKEAYRVETICIETIGRGDLSEMEIREMLIDELLYRFKEEVIRKVVITNDDEIYRIKFPVIVPNEE